jgi:hypothetical protein
MFQQSSARYGLERTQDEEGFVRQFAELLVSVTEPIDILENSICLEISMLP